MKRYLKNDDGLAVDILYSAYRDRPDCPAVEIFIANAAQYELAYLMNGEKIMGAAMRKGGCVHVGIIPAWRKRWATRGFMQEILRWAGETGKVWTRLAPGNAGGDRFLKGFGFAKEGARYVLPIQP